MANEIIKEQIRNFHDSSPAIDIIIIKSITFLASKNRSNLTSTFEEHFPDFNSKRKTWELAIS